MKPFDMFDERTLVDTPIGPIGVAWKDGRITGVNLDPDSVEGGENPLPAALADGFGAYFRDGSVRLDLPVVLAGTPFQRRVWQALQSIPPGRTVTYGELARKLETSARAIGGACRANPCPILVPCHRVVGRTGLGGFSGDTSGRKLEVKRRLLRHEGNGDY